MPEEHPSHWIPDQEWEIIVRNVPIVSADLVIRVDDGVLLGKRENEPVKGEWFVPGGTVFKGETRTEAVHRVAKEELGTDVTIERRLGTYEHFYDTADVESADGKQYLGTTFEVTPVGNEFEPDDQHSDLRVFSAPYPELHPYMDGSLDSVGVLDRAPALADGEPNPPRGE